MEIGRRIRNGDTPTGILDTWYEFAWKNALKRKKKKLTLMDFGKSLFTYEAQKCLFKYGEFDYANVVLDYDTFQVYINTDTNQYAANVPAGEKGWSQIGGYGKRVTDTYDLIRSDHNIAEIGVLKSLIEKYGEDWHELAEELYTYFDKYDNKYNVDIRESMKHRFNNITEDESGKETMANGLFACLCLVLTGEPETENTGVDSKEYEEYREYADTYLKYGKYSYQCNLMLKKLSDAKNRYAMFDLAQMYYYGQGISREKRYDKAYSIYSELKDLNFKYPLFLWARADFIIEYFDSKDTKGIPSYGIRIPELDKLQNHDLYLELVQDLISAEQRGCGAAANLCGRILDGMAIKREKLDADTNYQTILSKLKVHGDKLEHFKKGASLGNCYAYYNLYNHYINAFAYGEDPEQAVKDLNEAISKLESSAELEHPRAINEIALLRIWGIKRFAIKKMQDQKDHLPNDQNIRVYIEEHYSDGDGASLWDAYCYLDKIYESSIRNSDFKWPVNNMIEYICMNPDFIWELRKNCTDRDEFERIKAKVSDISGHIDDIDTALSNLKDGDDRVRTALERTRIELEKRLKTD